MRKKTALVLLILFVSAAGAQTVEEESVVVDLEDSSVTAEIGVEEQTTNKFTYLTNYDVKNLEATSGGEEVECSVNNLALGSEILCEPPSEFNYSIKLEFQGSGFLERQGETRIFRYSKNISRPTDRHRMKVILPPESAILEEGNFSTPVIRPSGGEVRTDGRKIFVTWDQNPELPETLRFQVLYERYSDERDYLQLALVFTGLIMALVFFYLGYRRWTTEKIEAIYEDLSEDEIKVIEMLREGEGSMLQKDVVDRTEYSKAKVSGIVSSLVDSDIIAKEKEGRSNKLMISKRYRG